MEMHAVSSDHQSAISQVGPESPFTDVVPAVAPPSDIAEATRSVGAVNLDEVNGHDGAGDIVQQPVSADGHANTAELVRALEPLAPGLQEAIAFFAEHGQSGAEPHLRTLAQLEEALRQLNVRSAGT